MSCPARSGIRPVWGSTCTPASCGFSGLDSLRRRQRTLIRAEPTAPARATTVARLIAWRWPRACCSPPIAVPTGRRRDRCPAQHSDQQVRPLWPRRSSASCRSGRRSGPHGQRDRLLLRPTASTGCRSATRRSRRSMRQAIVAIEDARFYQHGAIDLKGTIRASINNLQHKPVQGGSTLAQQYVKNVLYPFRAQPAGGVRGCDHRNPRPQDPRTADGRASRAPDDQEPDPRRLPERGLLRQLGLRRRGRRGALLQHRRVEAHAAAGGAAGRARGEPVRVRPDHQPEGGARPAATRCSSGWSRLGDITQADARAASRQPLGLHPSTLQKGCTSTSATATRRSSATTCSRSMKPGPGVQEAYQAAEPDRRAEDLHHPGPQGPARGAERGQLHDAAAAARQFNPGKQRGRPR